MIVIYKWIFGRYIFEQAIISSRIQVEIFGFVE